MGADQHNERYGRETFRVALACCRPALRGSWRQALALALLGGVALGAVAGARRTANAYERYLAAINASDMSANVPGSLPGMPATRPYELISALPRELALLKALGMTRGQVRGVIAWQTTLTLLIGGPLGIAGGRLAWHAFAGSLGIVPIVEVPVAALVLGLAVLVLAGNLLASLPATVAARTRPAIDLRAE